jgi:hypothetical protein
MTAHPDDHAPGWRAIDRALEGLYPGQKPLHSATVLHARIGGQDYLDGISVYRAEHPRPHWHFVTYGMTELYGKDWQDKERSGFGFEFTFRLSRDARTSPDVRPPGWAISFLQNLARYVWQSGNAFEPGHHMDLNGPIALETPTQITAALFAADPQLPAEITTPFGRVSFVQVVGISADELAAAEAWDTMKFLDVLAKIDPMLITDLDRGSWLTTPSIAEEVERGRQSDGSSTAVLYASNVAWALVPPDRLEITLGAKQVPALTKLLAGRLPFGRDFILAGGDVAVVFEPADAISWTVVEGGVKVMLPAKETIAALREVEPKQAVYRINDRVAIRVVPSRIKDHAGKVVQVIGE